MKIYGFKIKDMKASEALKEDIRNRLKYQLNQPVKIRKILA